MTTTEIVDLITREFPGWSAQRHDMRVILWRGDGPMPNTNGDTDRYAAVDPEPPIMAWPLVGAVGRQVDDILTAAEYATGEVALSRRDKAPVVDITAALAELRAAFPQYTWAASGLVIDTDEYGLCVEYLPASNKWMGGYEGVLRQTTASDKAANAFYALTLLFPTRPIEAKDPRKDFTTKPRIDLIPPGVLSRHVLPVLHDGAQKHGRDHWRGCTRREYALAAATHVLAYLDGEETDESGHAALAHAAADLLLGLGVE